MDIGNISFWQLKQALKEMDLEALDHLFEPPAELDWTQTSSEIDEKFEELFSQIGDLYESSK